MENYRYRCVDNSILLEPFKKYYVAFYFKLVPGWLTANFITLMSSLFMLAMFILIVQSDIFNEAFLGLGIAFCLHAYIVGDHLDGMQAKHTATGSALGEFLDHYLDVYNGAITFLLPFVYFNFLQIEIFLILLWIHSSAFAYTYVEQIELRELHFGVIGTLEGVWVHIFFALSWCVEPVRSFWLSGTLLGVNVYWIVILLVFLGYAGTLIDIFARLKAFPKQFIIYVIGSILLTYLLYDLEINRWLIWLTITFQVGEYIGKVMSGYLLSKAHEYPDLPGIFASGILLSIQLFDLADQQTVKWGILGLLGYYIFKVLWNFTTLVCVLRRFWYWTNPRRSEDSMAGSA